MEGALPLSFAGLLLGACSTGTQDESSARFVAIPDVGDAASVPADGGVRWDGGRPVDSGDIRDATVETDSTAAFDASVPREVGAVDAQGGPEGSPPSDAGIDVMNCSPDVLDAGVVNTGVLLAAGDILPCGMTSDGYAVYQSSGSVYTVDTSGAAAPQLVGPVAYCGGDADVVLAADGPNAGALYAWTAATGSHLLTNDSGGTAAVSPDGKLVVFSDHASSGSPDVTIAAVDGSGPRVLLPSAGTGSWGRFPAVRFAGSYVLIFWQSSGGYTLTSVAYTAQDARSDLATSSWLDGAYQVSPQSDLVAYTDGQLDLNVIPPQGGTPSTLVEALYGRTPVSYGFGVDGTLYVGSTLGLSYTLEKWTLAGGLATLVPSQAFNILERPLGLSDTFTTPDGQHLIGTRGSGTFVASTSPAAGVVTLDDTPWPACDRMDHVTLDGQFVTYCANGGLERPSELRAARIDGSEVISLGRPAGQTWAGTGTKLAFTLAIGATPEVVQSQLYALDLVSSCAPTLIANPVAWSFWLTPDRTRAVYSWEFGTTDASRGLYVAPIP